MMCLTLAVTVVQVSGVANVRLPPAGASTGGSAAPYYPPELYSGGSPVEDPLAAIDAQLVGGVQGQSVQPGNQVNPGTGDFTTSQSLFSDNDLVGPFGMTLTYDADLAQVQKYYGSPGPFGYGWSNSMLATVDIPSDHPNVGPVYVQEQNGAAIEFTTPTGDSCPAGDYQDPQKYTAPNSAYLYCAPYRVNAQFGYVAANNTFELYEDGGAEILIFAGSGYLEYVSNNALIGTDVPYERKVTYDQTGGLCPSGFTCTEIEDAGGRYAVLAAAYGLYEKVLFPSEVMGGYITDTVTYGTGSKTDDLDSIGTPDGDYVYTYNYDDPSPYSTEMTSDENADGGTEEIGWQNPSSFVVGDLNWGQVDETLNTAFSWHTTYAYLNDNCGQCIGSGQDQHTLVTEPDGEIDNDYYYQGVLQNYSFGSASTGPDYETWTFNYDYPSPSTQDGPTIETVVYPGADNAVATATIETDSVGNVLSYTNADGETTNYLYNDTGGNDMNELCLVAAPGVSISSYSCGQTPSGLTSYTYNADGQVLTATDPLGNVTNYAYWATGDAPGLLCYEAPPGVSVSGASCSSPPTDATTYTYDPYGDTLSTTVAYDGTGAAETTATYNDNSSIATSVAPDGNVSGGVPADYETAYSYSPSDNRLMSFTAPDSQTTSYTYDADGNVLTETDEAGVTTDTYDALGRLCWTVRSTSAVPGSCSFPGPSYSTSYEYLGDTSAVTEENDPEDHTTSYSYDDPAAPTEPTEVEDPNGTDVQYTAYDAYGAVCATGPVPVSTCTDVAGDSYDQYDPMGNLLASEDPNQQTTTYTYGDEQFPTQPTAVTAPQSGTTQYSYNADGEKSEVEELSLGDEDTPRIITYGYDGEGRTCWQANFSTSGGCGSSAPTSPNSSELVTTYTYDDNGSQLTDMQDKNGLSGAPPENVFTYDADGNLLSSTNNNGQKVTYAYNPADQVTCMSYPIISGSTCLGTPTGSYVSYGYDSAARMTSTTDWLGDTIDYGYSTNGLSQPTTTKVPLPGAGSGDSETLTDGYDSAGYDLTSADYSGTKAITGNSWTADSDELTASTSVQGTGGSVAYATQNWVTQATDSRPGQASHDTYGYDHNGQLASDTPYEGTATDYNYNSAEELTSQTGATTTTEAYDGFGERCFTYGGTTADTCASPPSGSASTTYSYSVYGQLTSVDAGGTTTNYRYDGLGHRIGSGSTNFLWNDVTDQEMDDGTYAYIYGPFGTAPVEQIKPTGTGDTGGTVDFLLSVPSGVQTVLNTSGTVVEAATYGTEGQRDITSGSAVTPFGFQGSYTDSSGLVFDLNRYYDPNTAQFLTVDPLVGATEQPFSFAGSDPVNESDPSGLMGGCEGPDCPPGNGVIMTPTGEGCSENCGTSGPFQTSDDGGASFGTPPPRTSPHNQPSMTLSTKPIPVELGMYILSLSESATVSGPGQDLQLSLNANEASISYNHGPLQGDWSTRNTLLGVSEKGYSLSMGTDGPSLTTSFPQTQVGPDTVDVSITATITGQRVSTNQNGEAVVVPNSALSDAYGISSGASLAGTAGWYLWAEVIGGGLLAGN